MRQIIKVFNAAKATFAAWLGRKTKPRRKRQLPKPALTEVEKVASHECGHAIVAWASPYVSNVSRITIVPNTKIKALGLVMYSHSDSLHGLLASATCTMGGLAGELEAHGKMRTGGGSEDIAAAVTIIRDAIARYGYHRVSLHLPTPPMAPDFGKWVSGIDTTTAHCLNAIFAKARLVIYENHHRFHHLRSTVLVERTITAKRLLSVLGSRPWSFAALLHRDIDAC